MSVRKLPAVLRFVWNHPLSREHRWARVGRFLQWHIASRLLPGMAIVPFVNDTRLLVRRGMHAATGNIYTGLQEFDEMSFALHALRPHDLFVDVGANIGAFTLLAAGAVGCQCLSIEPAEKAFGELRDNLRINQLDERVEAHRAALGATVGQVRVTASLDSLNRVVSDGDAHGPTCLVPMTTLDRLLAGRAPAVIKIDVEGYEPQVLAGAEATLRQPSLLAVMVETNRDVARGASDLDCIDQRLQGLGFQPCRYDGLVRRLQPVAAGVAAANTIYARSIDALNERCRQAPRFRVLDSEIQRSPVSPSGASTARLRPSEPALGAASTRPYDPRRIVSRRCPDAAAPCLAPSVPHLGHIDRESRMPRSFGHWTPRYVANRLMYACHQRLAPDAPWLTKRAVELIADWIGPTDVGLEWGSGRSTLWFAQRVARLTSIEHDPVWHARVNAQLASRGLKHVDYHLAPLDTPAESTAPRYVALGADGGDASVDFVLVDGQLRDLCTEAAVARLRPGGLLIIDNAELYFPRRTAAPSSMLRTRSKLSPLWSKLHTELAAWRRLWTTNGMWDTALFAKPAA